jgi:two-component system invasion response regulator UvrY
MIKIVIADDHPIVRKGLRDLFEDEFEMEVIGEASTGRETLNLIKKGIPDVVILDLRLPDASGLEILKQIKTLYPGIKVLALSALSEKVYGLRIIKAGADGFIQKDYATENLAPAVKRIMEGKRFISDSLADILAEEISKPAERPALSSREFEVLRLIGEGKSISEIADILKISVNTVSAYRKRILVKLNLSSTADLIKYCIREGVIEE